MPGDGNSAEDWRAEDKFAVVVETMGLAEAELAEYCRRKGLYVEQLERWRQACLQANAGGSERASGSALAEERKRSRQRELRRKEKASVEKAALLVLESTERPPGKRTGFRVCYMREWTSCVTNTAAGR